MIKNGIYGYWDKKKIQMVYIGQSENISRRHYHHMNPLRYNNQVINRIIQNNPDRYELIIIKDRPWFSKEDRDILEKHYIEFYGTFFDDKKFNYTPGGDFCPSTIPEIARKISKTNSQKRGSETSFYGKNHTEETKRKMRKVHLGKHLTKETIEKIRKAKLGKNHTEEAKRKMSLSRNTTGYRRVSLESCPSCKSGKRYKYRYFNDDGKRISISSVNLEKLKEKVLEKGLPWEKLN